MIRFGEYRNNNRFIDFSNFKDYGHYTRVVSEKEYLKSIVKERLDDCDDQSIYETLFDDGMVTFSPQGTSAYAKASYIPSSSIATLECDISESAATSASWTLNYDFYSKP